ncbi:MAG: GNAT family N-acetyltransferase [Actinomycetia bacterium]|nr:GNAT family N-acetyltransferase [Actinomycetes bacterium]
MRSVRLLGRYDMRPPQLTDAAELAAAYDRNRDHLAPYEPRRTPDFYTERTQRESLANAREEARHGRAAGWLILDGERVVGRVNLNTIVRGAAHCTHLGYWIDRDYNGQGLATTGVREACTAAAELGLHRIEAVTLVDNEASKAVLRKCDFQPIGHASAYLFIDGAWRDHDIFQLLLHDQPLR